MSKASFLILCSLAGVGHGIRQTTGRMEAGVMSFLIVCLLAIVTAVRRTAGRVELGVTGKQFGQQWKESNQSSLSGQIELNEDELGKTGEEVLEGTAVEVLEDTTGANPVVSEIKDCTEVDYRVSSAYRPQVKTAFDLGVKGATIRPLTRMKPKHEPCKNLPLSAEKMNEALAETQCIFNLSEGEKDVGKIVTSYLGNFGCNAFAPHDAVRRRFGPYIECDEHSQFVPQSRCGCTSCAKFVRETTEVDSREAEEYDYQGELDLVTDYELVMDACCIPKETLRGLHAQKCCQIL